MSYQTAGCSDPVPGPIPLQLKLPSLMSMAEIPLQNGQLLQDHWSTRSLRANLVPLYNVVDPLGYVCFQAMLPCLICPCKSFATSRKEYSCFRTDRALSFPATFSAIQLRPKQTLSEGYKYCRIQAKEINQSYVKRAGLQVFVLTSTQSFMQVRRSRRRDLFSKPLG